MRYFMFGKVSRVLLGMGLIGGIMGGDCSTVTEFSSQNAKMLIKSFTDSLEFKKPTRVFITLLGSLPHIVPGLDTLSENSGLPADKQFFMALFQIFSDPKRKVNNAEADAILESAEKGCQDAREMVSVVLGRRSPSEISDKQKTLMEQMQEIIDESSSEEDSSGVDSEAKNVRSGGNRTKLGEYVGDEDTDSEDSEEDYTYEQLQEHMFLGINSYLRDISDSDAKIIIVGTLKRMLSQSDRTKEELSSEIFPLGEYADSKPLYDELQRMIAEKK